ncbi:MAG TPA: hypothetical protein VHL11_21175 [Phototrophicaceae bacterium]|jgi:hypothetical protein|nr:hypothetical protein [Phototrophicaceae bacterium]
MKEPDNNHLNENPKGRGRQSSIDFVLPLQLEDTVNRIHQARENPSFKLVIWQEQAAESQNFTITLFNQGEIYSSATGVIEAWQDNLTRIYGTIGLTGQHPVFIDQSRLITFLLPGLLALVLFQIISSPGEIDARLPLICGSIVGWIGLAVLTTAGLQRWNSKLQSRHLEKFVSEVLCTGQVEPETQLKRAGSSFVLPLPTEEVFARIGQIPTSSPIRLASWCPFEGGTPGAKIAFKAVLDGEPVHVILQGQFKRWRGTSTRVQVERQSPEKFRLTGLTARSWMFLAITTALCLFCTLLALTSPDYGVYLLLIIVSIYFSLSFAAIIRQNRKTKINRLETYLNAILLAGKSHD